MKCKIAVSVGVLMVILACSFIFIFLCDLFFGTSIIWNSQVYEGSFESQVVKELVTIGSSRESSIKKLENVSWYHTEQINEDRIIEDIYLFEPKHPDQVKAVLVRSIYKSGEYVVDSIHELDREFIGIYGDKIPYLEMVESVIRPGNQRKSLINKFRTTWKHKVCNESTESIDDLLFFGGEFYGYTIVHIHSISKNGDMIIEYLEEAESLDDFLFCESIK